MTIAIRHATREDLPTILGLLAELDAGGTPTLSLAEAEAMWERLARYPDYRVLLAEDGAAPVGTYSLCILDNLGHRGAPEAVVENVVVAAAARGRGVGRTMMHDAMDRARARACYKLVLSSNLVRVEAHAFYEALGFRRHGVSFRVDL